MISDNDNPINGALANDALTSEEVNLSFNSFRDIAAGYSYVMGWTRLVFCQKMLMAFFAIIALAGSERIGEDRFSSEQHTQGRDLVIVLISLNIVDCNYLVASFSKLTML